ncbi:hypothetical protein [Amycolatopsis sp. NPDC059021]|uniref:hypothetical protein n=1 Tax=Amycolatopsis sp. NPDC059021 TaxID=3346704 RepID=UPI003671052E
MINELANLVVTYGVPVLLSTAALFGAAPKLVGHLLVLLYPRDHPRRRELLAELDAVPYRDRLMWVAGQAVTSLFEGLPARTKHFAEQRRGRKLRKAIERFYEESGDYDYYWYPEDVRGEHWKPVDVQGRYKAFKEALQHNADGGQVPVFQRELREFDVVVNSNMTSVGVDLGSIKGIVLPHFSPHETQQASGRGNRHRDAS